ncbi:MAG: TOBE domain-containing protein, partial [Halofilum sp. (in: g-proteobacteria)]
EDDCFRVRLDDGHELLARPDANRIRADGERVRVVLRAEKLLLQERHDAEPGESILDARVTAVDYQGQIARYFVDAKGTRLQVINPIDMRPFAEDVSVQLRIRARDCVLLDDRED